MILPAVRERLESIVRLPAMEGAVAALRAGGSARIGMTTSTGIADRQHIPISGLHDVAKALVAAYLAHESRRPAFFVTESNRRAEALSEALRFFSQIFPGAMGGVGVLPAFDTLPWQAQSPHP